MDEHGRLVIALNRGWEFHRPQDPRSVAGAEHPPDAATWEPASLPHTVRLEPLDASGCRNYQGPCWYRSNLPIDRSWRDRLLYLRFEGAMQVADVWLNGRRIATHYGGYLPFTIDITESVAFDTGNALLVRLDNADNPEVPPGRPQARLDFTYFGGLYREVRLEALDRLHITDEMLVDTVAGGGIFVRYPSVSAAKAEIDVQTDVANDHAVARAFTLHQDLVDAAGAVVASSTQDARLEAWARKAYRQTLVVDAPKLWHPHHPDLYNLRTRLAVGGSTVDGGVTRIGIRRISFTPEGLFINREKLFAFGFNRHQDHPYVGYAMPKSQHFRDAKRLRDAGFTSFRCHYPQDPAFMDACDELGIVCVVSNPGWQFLGNDTFVERTYRGAREMVRRDRNHACAILWEPSLNETDGASEVYCRKLHEAVHEEYPGDQCFTAGDPAIGNGGRIFDVLWSREPVAGKPTWTREWGDNVDNWSDQQGRVRVARGWGELPQLVQALNHLASLDEMLAKNGGPAATSLGGAGLWSGIDYCRGYHQQPGLCGTLDLFRLPKLGYHFFRSQRPPDVIVRGVECGPMVFIATYATALSPTTVVVFSNCEAVRLLVNGEPVATQAPDAGFHVAHPPFTFQLRKTNPANALLSILTVEPGYTHQTLEYRAEGLIDGRVAATHTVRSPGVMSRIDLAVDVAGRNLSADGADWVRVHAKICDERGTVHPLADSLVAFSVEGEGSIVGDSTVGANPVRAEAGIATVLVRATDRPGKIFVRAVAPGLAPGEATIDSVAPEQG